MIFYATLVPCVGTELCVTNRKNFKKCLAWTIGFFSGTKGLLIKQSTESM